MEKYVTEALFMMGEEIYGLDRHKKRFSPMVNNDKYTTLFEGWGIGEEGFGGGTVNHACERWRVDYFITVCMWYRSCRSWLQSISYFTPAG